MANRIPTRTEIDNEYTRTLEEQASKHGFELSTAFIEPSDGTLVLHFWHFLTGRQVMLCQSVDKPTPIEDMASNFEALAREVEDFDKRERKSS